MFTTSLIVISDTFACDPSRIVAVTKDADGPVTVSVQVGSDCQDFIVETPTVAEFVATVTQLREEARLREQRAYAEAIDEAIPSSIRKGLESMAAQLDEGEKWKQGE